MGFFSMILLKIKYLYARIAFANFLVFRFKIKVCSYCALIIFAHRALASCCLGCLELRMDPQYLCKTRNRGILCCMTVLFQLSENKI